PAGATPEAPPMAPAAVPVSQDWDLIPLGPDGNRLLKPGQSFRLLFITEDKRDASSTKISDYNTFVQEQAGENSELELHKDKFRAVISTAAVHARDNTAAETAGDCECPPVYWVKGGSVVAPGGDLYEDDWSGAPAKDQIGAAPRSSGGFAAGQIWTGTFWSGRSWSLEVGNTGRFYAGAKYVQTGDPGTIGNHIQAGWDPSTANSTQLRLYGISPVFIVTAAPRITGLAVTSDPGADRTYAAGDDIEVTFTFDKDLVLSGSPQLTLHINRSPKTAGCAAHGSDASKLVCTYRVISGDLDVHGIRVLQSSLAPPADPGWIRDGVGNDADLEHEGLGTQSGHKVIAVAPAPGKPSVTFTVSNDGRVLETGSGTTLTAKLDKASTQAITIRVLGRSVVIPRGQLSGSITIPARDNEVDQPDRVREWPVTYDPANAVNVAGSHQRIAVTVVDDDPSPRPTISLRQSPAAGTERTAGNVGSVLGDGASASVAEGGTFVVWVELDRPSGDPTTVTISVRATGSVDHTILPHARDPDIRTFTTYIIESGETTPEDDSSLVAIRIADDAVKNAGVRTLTITATATNAHGVTQPAQTLTVTVTDND
ncbi:MAG: hypothetical protein OXC11_00580, partial [Rhodospirillales bacterium]|nr:hypothetical protein [Rhodospirillales bacterium]